MTGRPQTEGGGVTATVDEKRKTSDVSVLLLRDRTQRRLVRPVSGI